MSHATHVGRKAFTLVELLVVISIITLLIALLIPALGRARFNTRVSICASNWRQWAVGAANYAGDNNGQFPRYDIQRSIGLNVWGVGNGLLPTMHEYGVGPDMWYCPVMGQDDLPWWMQPYRLDDDLLASKDVPAIIAHGQSFWPEFTMTQVMWWVPRRATNGWLPHDNSFDPAEGASDWPAQLSQPNVNERPLISDLLGIHPAEGPLDLVDLATGGHRYGNGPPESVNAAFADGHVELRTESEFESRLTQHYGNVY